MTNRLPAWFPLVLLILLAALTFWLDRAVQPTSPARDGSSRHDPDYVVENFSATRMGPDGAPRYTLSAKKMWHYPDDDTTHLERPRFVSTEPAKPALRAKADRAMLSSNGDNVYLSGNVVMLREADDNQGEMTIASRFLHIIPDDDIIKTDKAATITGTGFVIHAVGAVINNRTRVMQLLSQVKVVHNKVKVRK